VGEDMIVKGAKILYQDSVYLTEYTLRPDLVDSIVNWLNDDDVSQYLKARESRPWDTEMLYEWANAQKEKGRALFFIGYGFGEYENLYEIIGTATVGPVTVTTELLGQVLVRQSAPIGLMIGRKDLWGQGIGMRAIRLLAEFGFKTWTLDEVWATVQWENATSCKAFVKAGFDYGPSEKEGIAYLYKRRTEDGKS
jgi:RimJ/RimL family protein N-acetyltransferase